VHDIIVIGAGPAGLAAAVYTLRHHLTTLVIAPDLAGKARFRLRLPWVEGHETITGEETVEQLRQQVMTTPRATRYLDMVEHVFVHDQAFQVITAEGGAFSSRAVIVATGVTPRALGVTGEQRLLGYGVSHTAISQAPLFAGRRVVVVGSDLRALRAVAELRMIAAHVTLVVPDAVGLGGYILSQHLSHDERVTVLAPATVTQITGENAVAGLVVATPDGRTQHIPADGVFIEHGLEAHTSFLGTLAERTPSGQIVVNDRCATRSPGLFAAGDTTSTAYAEQILIALGEGMKAGISASTYLHENMRLQLEAAR
jgi:thioredoxin reductase